MSGVRFVDVWCGVLRLRTPTLEAVSHVRGCRNRDNFWLMARGKYSVGVSFNHLSPSPYHSPQGFPRLGTRVRRNAFFAHFVPDTATRTSLTVAGERQHEVQAHGEQYSVKEQFSWILSATRNVKVLWYVVILTVTLLRQLHSVQCLRGLRIPTETIQIITQKCK